jgi:hypothetical protein
MDNLLTSKLLISDEFDTPTELSLLTTDKKLPPRAKERAL